jgi:hypothetical protein
MWRNGGATEMASMATYVLPWWMQWIQAIGVALISGIGVFIAYRQARISTAKLNLDLYDRRFKVFDTARKYIGSALDQEDLFKATVEYNVGTSDAIFLFEKDVDDYLISLRKKGIGLHAKRRQLRALGNSEAQDGRRGDLADKIGQTEQEFTTEYERLIQVFKPYLKLGNI